MGMMMEDIASYFRQENNSMGYKHGDSFNIFFGILTSGIVTAQSRFQSFLNGIIIPKNVCFKSSNELIGSENVNDKLIDLKERLTIDSNTPDAFGTFKYSLDSFFFEITHKGKLEYRYNEEKYLVTPTKAAEELNVTRQSINNYIRLGLESIEGSKHKKIPLHVLYLWKNPVWASKIQILHGQYKVREQSAEEKYQEIIDQIKSFEKEYKNKFEVVFKEVIEGSVDWDDLDHASDYLKWLDLEEEKKALEDKKGLN